MARTLEIEKLLWAYHNGWFPMAEQDGEIFWYQPKHRGVFELEGLRISRSLRQTMKKGKYTVRINKAFRDVMLHCAAPTVARRETWISDEIIRAYCELHDAGYAHSVETWCGETLAGGLYGVTIGGAFFGESMFTLAPDASKIALVALVARLRERNFILLDTQFITPHLQRLGAHEIPSEEYMLRLHRALLQSCTFI